MVSPEDVIELCQTLAENGIRVWLTGGWGIDALLGAHTRPHKDLDLLVLLDDVVPICRVLGQRGFTLKDIWPENLWVVEGYGDSNMTAFVLHDDQSRELDLHAMRQDQDGNLVAAWQDDGRFVFSPQDRENEGSIAGLPVRCLTPHSQMLCHTGYDLPEYQVPDLVRLHQKFGVEYPDALAATLEAAIVPGNS